MANLFSNVRDLSVSISISESKYRLLKMYLAKDAENGAPLATMLAQVALFTASVCLEETRICSKYDESGIKTAVLYHICAVLLCYTNRWNRLGIARRRWGAKVNSIANLICLVLGILFQKFYETSLSVLCFALSMTILFLILLVIIQPRTDLGFFSFQIGTTGSAAYNLFQLKLGTWIVVAVCLVLLDVKCWLDKNWLEQEENEYLSLPTTTSERSNNSSRLSNPLPKSVIQSIGALMVAGFSLVWEYILLSTNCLNSKSCASCSGMETLKCGAIYGLWLSPAHIHGVYSLFQVEYWVLWPKTMRYTTAIATMEYRLKKIKNKIKKVKEAGWQRDRELIWNAEEDEKKMIDHKLLIMELQRPEVIVELPKWLRKRIEDKILKIGQDTEAEMSKLWYIKNEHTGVGNICV